MPFAASRMARSLIDVVPMIGRLRPRLRFHLFARHVSCPRVKSGSAKSVVFTNARRFRGRPGAATSVRARGAP
jgi:hypothetical protein